MECSNVNSSRVKISKPKDSSTKFKRPWAAKTSKEDVDIALLKTATTLAEKVLQTPEPENKRQYDEIEDEDSLFCWSLAQRMKGLNAHANYLLDCRLSS